MNEYASYLEPGSEWLPGLDAGLLKINVGANRVIDARTGEFVGALVPSADLSNQLASLPSQPHLAAQVMANSAELSKLQPALSALQLTSTVGALASVATLAVSCAGFALVLRRLNRIDAKLDELLGKVEVLQRAVNSIRTHAETLSLARIRAAGESLDRALAASTREKRVELSSRARDLFQEAKAHYLELWLAARPWEQLEVSPATAVELQGRYVACAVGEIQAEFLGGDLATFRQAALSAAADVKGHFTPVVLEAFRARCDAACARGRPTIALFGQEMENVAKELGQAAEITATTAQHLEASLTSAEIVERLGVEPHEFLAAQRAVRGADLMLVRLAA
jgi:hypothetical protein